MEDNEKNDVKDEQAKVEESKQTKEEVKKKSKSSKLPIIITLAVIIIIVAIIAVYFIFFSAKTIDLSKYIDVKYNGFNGYATAEVSINVQELKKKIKNSNIAKRFAKKIEFEVKDNEKLSNGDKLEIEASISNSWLKDKKLKLKDKKFDIKVEDLEEGNEVDIFKDIEIKVEGISPNLSISVSNNSSDKFLSTVSYSVKDNYNLANGDKVTITAYYDEDDAEEAGIVVAKDTMEYTIKDQSYYINSKKDLKDEKIVNPLQDSFRKKVKEEADDSNYLMAYAFDDVSYSDKVTASEPELVDYYLLTAKKKEGFYNSYNKIYYIYKVVFTSSTGVTHEWYFTACTENIAVSADGKLLNDNFNIFVYTDKGKTLDESYDYYIDEQKKDYTIESLKK